MTCQWPSVKWHKHFLLAKKYCQSGSIYTAKYNKIGINQFMRCSKCITLYYFIALYRAIRSVQLKHSTTSNRGTKLSSQNTQQFIIKFNCHSMYNSEKCVRFLALAGEMRINFWNENSRTIYIRIYPLHTHTPTPSKGKREKRERKKWYFVYCWCHWFVCVPRQRFDSLLNTQKYSVSV